MLIVSIVSGVLAAASLGVSLVLALRVRKLEEQLRSPRPAVEAPPLQLPVASRPLEGLRIAIEISQDHPNPIFANLLKEQLLQEDVADVSSLPNADWQDSIDIIVKGTVLCNGYAEIYYQAEIECSSENDVIASLTEKPANGDRQANLAIEVVDRLKVELEKLVSRNERRRAIRELHSSD